MNKQIDPERAAYMAAFTLERLQSHNAIHEALLMNGYEVTFHPADCEDTGGPESGPMVTGHPGYFEYESDWEYVYTELGEIKHREKRDPAAEAWIAQQQSDAAADYYLGDHDVGPLSFEVRYDATQSTYYYVMANETDRSGPFKTSEGAYLAAIGE